ncbi:MAG: polysaccharide biosynthesis/export family protein [Deltaproteobacteria bacterium]|nr:polysaccharide biosynthesis/export family protein [Deltaproteobacteria bacterium]MBV8953986.1 polysaccharide biosynthesis/export family protein [Solirubrobacterales bacterium]
MVIAALLNAACGGGSAAVRVKNLPSAVVSQKEEVLPKELIDAQLNAKDGEPYRVGPGDVLMVLVFGHPELAIGTYMPAGATLTQTSRTVGLVIDNDGTIQLPLIGAVNVAGKSSEEIRALVEQRLSTYLKDPHVTVQVLFNGSIRYYLLGEFAQPGIKFADRPMRLLEALSLGGSVLFEQASLRGAYLARAGKKLPINFYRLLREGDMRQNIRLQPEDTVVVPDNRSEQVFVFGGAAGGMMKGGPVPMINGRLDLLQALAVAGIGYQERAQGRLDQVHVIRSEFDRGQLFVVNADAIIRGDAAPFPLAAGDIVFVPETAVTRWNQVIGQLLPSLQAISALLNPFVQIKFLSQ